MSMHISAQVGEISNRILLPGDPLRAKYIAEKYLESAVCFNEIRGMYGYTGMYQGVRVSVMGTGMGVPSMHIYSRELIAEYGCNRLIRIGTAGSYEPTLHVGELVISKGCCYTTNIMNDMPGTYCPVADHHLVATAEKKAKEMGIPARVGLTVCNDILYLENRPEKAKRWNDFGVIASEMESAALYLLAAQFRAQAVTIMNISNNIVCPDEAPLSSQAREKELDDMIRLALETAIAND